MVLSRGEAVAPQPFIEISRLRTERKCDTMLTVVKQQKANSYELSNNCIPCKA